MSLQYKFRQACRFIDGLSVADRHKLNTICDDIQAAERNLSHNAARLLDRCYNDCEGLCCRNLDIDAVIDKTDMVYLLTMADELRDTIASVLKRKRLAQATAAPTTDCYFLIKGTGPCRLPAFVRPSACLTTFCDDHTVVKKEIGRLKRKFFKLSVFMLLKTSWPLTYRREKTACR